MQSQIKFSTGANRQGNIDFPPWKTLRLDPSHKESNLATVANPGPGIISSLMNGPVLGERFLDDIQHDHKDNTTLASSVVVVEAMEDIEAGRFVLFNVYGHCYLLGTDNDTYYFSKRIAILNKEALPDNKTSVLVHLYPEMDGNSNFAPSSEKYTIGVSATSAKKGDHFSVIIEHSATVIVNRPLDKIGNDVILESTLLQYPR